MFYLLSKIFGSFLLPSNLLVGIGTAGAIVAYTGNRALGRKLMAICIAGLLVCGLLPIGDLLLIPIESRFPTSQRGYGHVDGIIVLGGGLERIFEAIPLARENPQAKLLYTGGSIVHDAYTKEAEKDVRAPDDLTEADVAARLFESCGIPRDRLLLEENALNTFENAKFSKVIAAPKHGERWLLVTSAFHMPRAIGVFRRTEFKVEAYPVDRKTAGWSDLFRFRRSFLEQISLADLGTREWIGLLAYRLTGRTSELLP